VGESEVQHSCLGVFSASNVRNTGNKKSGWAWFCWKTHCEPRFRSIVRCSASVQKA